MIRCQRCVMPNTRPDTAFVDGLCSACIAYDKRPTINWAERYEHLLALLARARGIAQDRELAFDCIVPSSGGKDSTYQVLQLLELNARPLVVTASTCHLTPIGRENIENLKRYATTIEVSPQRTARAELNKIGLTRVGDISWPEHVGIFTTPFKVAARTGIPLMFYGENPQNQYGGPLEELEARQMTRRWVSEFGGFLGMRPADLVGEHPALTAANMADYVLSESELAGLMLHGVEAHFLGQYIAWDSHRNATWAKNAGMKAERPCPANWWAHENLDNAQTGIHDHVMFRKFGYGRGCAQISVDVRAGLVTRGEAMDWVDENDGRFPLRYAGVSFADMLDHIGMDQVAFGAALDQFTNLDLFEAPLASRPMPSRYDLRRKA